MRRFANGVSFYRNSKLRREKQLRRLAQMRAAKERKRMERDPVEPEPKLVRWHPFDFGVRDKRTGEVAWHDLVSVRHAEIAFRMLLQAERIV
jgi:hypothetical protein